MTAVHKFLVPFAGSGDKTEIPTDVQADGSVSYPEGWGFDYSRNPSTDPLAKRIDRGTYNQLMYDITSALGRLQTLGAPEWITTAENAGNPYPYAAGAVVRYGSAVYQSLVGNNIATPGTDATKWAVVSGHNGIWSAPATGAANVYTATLSPAPTAYAVGQIVFLKIATANTGAATFNVNGLGAVSIKKWSSGALAALSSGDLPVGFEAILAYDGTQFQLLNAPPSLSGYVTSTQYQNNAPIIPTATGGTADAITATYSPAITALTNGMSLMVRASSINTTTTPTFTPASGTIAAKTIVKGSGAALVAGDIAGAGHWIELQYDQTLDKWVLLNPATGVSGMQTSSVAEVLAGVNATKAITPASLSGAMGNSLAAAGYQKFSSGLILQWGIASISAVGGTGGSATVSLPVAFPNGGLRGFVSRRQSTGDVGEAGWYGPYVRSLSTTQIVVAVDDVATSGSRTVDVEWFAFGN